MEWLKLRKFEYEMDKETRKAYLQICIYRDSTDPETKNPVRVQRPNLMPAFVLKYKMKMNLT